MKNKKTSDTLVVNMTDKLADGFIKGKEDKLSVITWPMSYKRFVMTNDGYVVTDPMGLCIPIKYNKLQARVNGRISYEATVFKIEKSIAYKAIVNHNLAAPDSNQDPKGYEVMMDFGIFQPHVFTLYKVTYTLRNYHEIQSVKNDKAENSQTFNPISNQNISDEIRYCAKELDSLSSYDSPTNMNEAFDFYYGFCLYMDSFYDYTDPRTIGISLCLYKYCPEFFFPNFMALKKGNLENFLIDNKLTLPVKPSRRNERYKCMYYMELCRVLCQYRDEHSLSSSKLCAVIYEYDNLYRIDEKDLPV